jgi:hypothetical protein
MGSLTVAKLASLLFHAEAKNQHIVGNHIQHNFFYYSVRLFILQKWLTTGRFFSALRSVFQGQVGRFLPV